MRVLVTGASGFLGSHVAEQLAAEGHDVVALVRSTSSRRVLDRVPRIRFALGAVEDAASTARAVEGVDAIVHAAGLVKARSPAEFRAINVTGTENLLAAARAHAPGLRRFVFVSSLAAVGPSHDGKPVSSDRTPSPVTHYGRSKLEAERAALAAKGDLPVTVVRPPMIYGPRDSETFAFFQTVSRGVLPLVAGGENTLSVVYVGDAASACVRAIFADVPSGRAYFVEDGTVYRWRDMLADVERALGKRAWVRLSLPFAVIQAAAVASEAYGRATGKAVMLTRDKLNELGAPHWVCDASDTRRELGWQPEVGWAEGTRRAASWYRSEGWL